MALILLITIAVLAGIDVVMYLVLSVVDRHWEMPQGRSVRKGLNLLRRWTMTASSI